ncbi:UNVERIFIED_CONTAM: hypothetical protein K2H54_061216 [Gekko kuhli]
MSVSETRCYVDCEKSLFSETVLRIKRLYSLINKRIIACLFPHNYGLSVLYGALLLVKVFRNLVTIAYAPFDKLPTCRLASLTVALAVLQGASQLEWNNGQDRRHKPACYRLMDNIVRDGHMVKSMSTFIATGWF